MDTTPFRTEVAALRAATSAMGGRLEAAAGGADPDELFELVGELQRLVSAAEGAQLVAIAHACAHEMRLTDRGQQVVHHAVGYVDDMAPTEVSLATGVGQWAAGRRVSLAAGLAERFPRILRRVVIGDVPAAIAGRVASTCDGLDAAACTAVEDVMVGRLGELDPSRVTTVTRRVASRVAAEQVREVQRRHRRDRCVETSPGPDGTTSWWAQLPTDRSAAAWAAICALADRYAAEDEGLTADQAKADAFLDLLLTDVTVSATVTLGVPVLRTEPAAAGASDDDVQATGHAVGAQGLGPGFRLRASLDGCELPGLGWVDADTVELLFQTVPLEVGRAVLDARTGAVLETTSIAYSPPPSVRRLVALRDGTCRMWGCSRPAERCDLDHARPWPAGATSPANLAGLCRRHHRLKQRRRWQYRLEPDGTVTWTSPNGLRRTTLPEHAPWPPPSPGTDDPAPMGLGKTVGRTAGSDDAAPLQYETVGRTAGSDDAAPLRMLVGTGAPPF